MARNAWWLWVVSGMNLSLGVIIGWLVTQWVLVIPANTPVNNHYVPNVKPLPPQIGKGLPEHDVKVPEPVELSRSQYEFNHDLALVSSLEKLKKDSVESFVNYNVQVQPLSQTAVSPKSAVQRVTNEEPVQAELISSSVIFPDPAQVQELIKQSTPDPNEQQVWEETLQGMPLEAVEDILKFRRNYGMASQAQLEMPAAIVEITPKNLEVNDHQFYEPAVEELPKNTLPHAQGHALPKWKKETIKHLDQELKCLETTAAIQAYNLANAKVPWFRRVIPKVVSNGLSGAEMRKTEVSPEVNFTADHGPEVIMEISNDEPKLIESKDRWDVALTGNALFCINEGNFIMYVRGGKLTTDENGVLCLMAGKNQDLFQIEPTITIPADLKFKDITFTAEGVVQAEVADETVEYGRLMIGRILDDAYFDEPEPGIFVRNDKTTTSDIAVFSVENLDIDTNHNTIPIKLMFGKTGGSTVNQQAEIMQFEKTLTQIAKLKEFKKQVLAD